MKFNLKGLTAYQLDLIRFCLNDHKEQLADMIEEVHLSASELKATAREMRACRSIMSEICRMLASTK